MSRIILEKTEYLLGLEQILQKYGYERVFSAGVFDGVKRPGITICIPTKMNNKAVREIVDYIDPTVGLDSFSHDDVCCCLMLEELNLTTDKIIYERGTFYGVT